MIPEEGAVAVFSINPTLTKAGRFNRSNSCISVDPNKQLMARVPFCDKVHALHPLIPEAPLLLRSRSLTRSVGGHESNLDRSSAERAYE
eukprot:4024776-Karenia_brevis.AAC.1